MPVMQRRCLLFLCTACALLLVTCCLPRQDVILSASHQESQISLPVQRLAAKLILCALLQPLFYAS